MRDVLNNFRTNIVFPKLLSIAREKRMGKWGIDVKSQRDLHLIKLKFETKI